MFRYKIISTTKLSSACSQDKFTMFNFGLSIGDMLYALQTKSNLSLWLKNEASKCRNLKNMGKITASLVKTDPICIIVKVNDPL